MTFTIRRKPDGDDQDKLRYVSQAFWNHVKPRDSEGVPRVMPEEVEPAPASGGSPSLLGYIGGSFVGTYTNKELEQRAAQAAAAESPREALTDHDPFGRRAARPKSEDGYVDFSKYDDFLPNPPPDEP